MLNCTHQLTEYVSSFEPTIASCSMPTTLRLSMPRLTSFFLILTVLSLTLGCDSQSDEPAPTTQAPETLGDWQLVWNDEFDGPDVDESKWTFQNGDGCDINLCGWGNNELQWYLPHNATIEDGHLVIIAQEQTINNRSYTSSRMRSKDKGDWRYGRFEVRAKLPRGQGLWPAIWMMPTDNVYGGWAASGEIDIMEALGHEPAKVHGTLHYGASWPNNRSSGDAYTLSSGTFTDDFHVFAIEWEAGEIRWYVDDTLYLTQNNWSTTDAAFPAPFDQRFHFILNVAVGGNWPGSPDASTSFPQQLTVDYVRVYQK